MPEPPTSDSAEPLSEADLRSFITRHLPAWQQACDADDAESIVLHEASFGTSTRELVLFACAIKYAAAKGKHVYVTTGPGRIRRAPETVLPGAALGFVYREDTSFSRHAPVPRGGGKRANNKK
jgi:hypothetical protein